MNQVALARVEVGCDDAGLGHGFKVVYSTSRVHEVEKVESMATRCCKKRQNNGVWR